MTQSEFCVVSSSVMDDSETGKFGAWDYVVLAAMLVISAGIGVYYRFTGGRQKTTQVIIHTLISSVKKLIFLLFLNI